jgi:hypothetical protein
MFDGATSQRRHLTPETMEPEPVSYETPVYRPRVGWILTGDISTGSSRIHGLNIHDFLLDQGVKSHIIQSRAGFHSEFRPSPLGRIRLAAQHFDIVVFQKVLGPKARRLNRQLQKRGVRTVFLQSDLVLPELAHEASTVVVVSEYLRDHFRRTAHLNATVIEDALEGDLSLFKVHREARTPVIVWFGHRDNWSSYRTLCDLLNSAASGRFTFRSISNHPDADVPWKLG